MNEINIDISKVGKRLSEYLQSISIGTNETGRILGTSGSQVSNILNGRNFGVDKLLLILSHFPNLNPIWLLTGEGSMLHSHDRATINEDNIHYSTTGTGTYTQERMARLEDEIKYLKNENKLLREMVDVLKSVRK